MLKEAFAIWERNHCTCSLLSGLFDASCMKEKSTWPTGHMVITKKNLIPNLFYIGSPRPKLLLLIDCSQKQQAMISILGARTYPEPLSVCRVPIVMQTIQKASALNYSEQLIAVRGATRRMCYLLHKVGVADFCPWHQEDDPDHFRSNHQILHLVGKIQPSGEINVMGYIDEIPLHWHILFFHVISNSLVSEMQRRICPLDVPFLLPSHANSGASF